MNRLSPICILLALLIIPVSSEDNSTPYKDNISRLEHLGFHYFPAPLHMTAGRLIDREGRTILVNGSSEQILLIVFINRDDPFTPDLRAKLARLSEDYSDDPFKIIIVSSAEEDYKDRGGRSGDKWGVLHYPTLLLIDHNFLLRGSSEGIYPDIASDDFRKVIDELILNIHTPGVINTLQ